MNGNDQILSVIGYSHNTASQDLRESLQISRKDTPEVLRFINSIFGIDGALIISTCNRLEFYIVSKSDINLLEIIKNYYSEAKSINIREFGNLLYHYESEEATRHLFRVISGLDSLVLGEYQIQGQVKEAYSIACEHKTVEKVLHKLLHAAFRVGKKIRSATSLGSGRQSVSGEAARIIIENVPPGEKVTLIGVNENTRIMAEALTNAGFYNFIFVNRTLHKAQMLAEKFGGKALGLVQLDEALDNSYAVFTSTAAPGFIIGSEQILRFTECEKCPKIIVDMAIPRDIDTSALPDYIAVYDIDRLQRLLDEKRQITFEDIPAAEKIIEEEVALFQAWSDTQGSSMLEPYAEKFELLRRQALEEFKGRFSPQGYEQAEKLSRSLVHRLQSVFISMLVKNAGK